MAANVTVPCREVADARLAMGCRLVHRATCGVVAILGSAGVARTGPARAAPRCATMADAAKRHAVVTMGKGPGHV